MTLAGHRDDVNAFDVSPDGSHLGSVSGGQWKQQPVNEVKRWNIASGQTVFTLRDHSGMVTDVDFHPDGTKFLTCSLDGTTRVRDAKTGQTELTLAKIGGFYSARFSHDGKRIVTGGLDFNAYVWDATTGEEIIELAGHSEYIRSVAFSPDDQRIVTGCDDTTIKTWDADSGEELISIGGNPRGVYSVTFDSTGSPDGSQVVSGSHQIHLSDAVTGDRQLTLEGNLGVSGIAFRSDAKRIAACSWDGSLAIWDATTGKRILTTECHDAALLSLAYSPDGDRIAAGTGDGKIKLYTAQTGDPLLDIPLRGDIKGVVFTPDGKRVIAGSTAGAIKAFDSTTGEELLTFGDHTEAVYSMALSDDGSKLVTGGPTQTVYVWDPATGDQLATLDGHVIQIYAVDINSDGTRVIATGSDDSLELRGFPNALPKHAY